MTKAAVKQTNTGATNNINVATKPKAQVNNSVTNQAVAKPLVPATSAPKRINIADLDEPTHIVQKGENLYQISMTYNITISTLRRWNDLTNENIHVGQTLRLTKPN